MAGKGLLFGFLQRGWPCWQWFTTGGVGVDTIKVSRDCNKGKGAKR